MMKHERLVQWAVELQSIAQAGLAYSKNPYDLERFERVREIAAEIMSEKTGVSLDRVTDIFCSEKGFQTPKLDTRAAIFKDDKILLVKETLTDTWSMPGGWVDVDQSIASNTVKEVKEEAGLDVVADRLVAMLDRNRHNTPPYAHGICKAFVLCTVIGGEFTPNLETSESGYFALDNLPELSVGKNTEAQIRLCHEAYLDERWRVVFD
ncbi:MAG: ADP-ribose pyrophosphatase [Firmicutes bacterium]|nr:ADP-ribose pyrophosphatase [Bacillota bacterium]